MAKADRNGKRKTRDQRIGMRVQEMGYYVIVTDTKATERCYFYGLRDSLSKDVKNKLAIKVFETKTQNLIQGCLKIVADDAQFRIPWIVFDRDQVKNFDQIIEEAKKYGINVGWSNPCFEIWMFAYFGGMPAIENSRMCCSEFGKLYVTRTGRNYSKSDTNIYKYLCEVGDETQALKLAADKYQQHAREGKSLPSEMCPATTVYELVEEIKGKVANSTSAAQK